jgi:hypothetical protein
MWVTPKEGDEYHANGALATAQALVKDLTAAVNEDAAEDAKVAQDLKVARDR